MRKFSYLRIIVRVDRKDREYVMALLCDDDVFMPIPLYIKHMAPNKVRTLPRVHGYSSDELSHMLFLNSL